MAITLKDLQTPAELMKVKERDRLRDFIETREEEIRIAKEYIETHKALQAIS